MVPELLPARLRDPRLPRGARLPGLARLRPRADVDRDEPLRAHPVRLSDLRVLLGGAATRTHGDPGAARADLGVDRGILDGINRRLELVARLKRHKDEHGISFVDPEREASLVEARVRENPGPLSEQGVRSFYAEVLALTKRELEPPGTPVPQLHRPLRGRYAPLLALGLVVLFLLLDLRLGEVLRRHADRGSS